MGCKVKFLRNKTISIDKLFFQYTPGRIPEDLFCGTREEMMNVKNTPHFRFVKLYLEIGNKILEKYKETDYCKLMIYWNRTDKHNKWKIKRFIKTINYIKQTKKVNTISVLDKPMHQKMFNDGYEIYHGHHRVAVWAALNHQNIKCKVFCKKGT